MSNSSDDETKKNLPAVDGFDGIENDGVEDEEGQLSTDRVIQGKRLGFTNDFVWMIGNDEEFPEGRELVVIDTVRLVQKWVDKKPGPAIFVGSHEKWPNVAKLNEACPKSEWGQDFNGNPQGPWHRQRVVYFVDLNSMEKFTWPSRVDTVGADVCIREFREKVRMMRQFRGTRVFAVVTLDDTFMPTRYGGRQRPDLKIARWILLGPEGSRRCRHRQRHHCRWQAPVCNLISSRSRSSRRAVFKPSRSRRSPSRCRTKSRRSMIRCPNLSAARRCRPRHRWAASVPRRRSRTSPRRACRKSHAAK